MTTQPPLQVPSDALTKKLLRKAVGGSLPLLHFLEFLCVDDIYTFKDDFDREDGLDTTIWAAYKIPEDDPEEDATHSGSFFRPVDGAACGIVAVDPGAGEGDRIALLQRRRDWLPSHRPTVMCRASTGDALSGTWADSKLEFGFADIHADLLYDCILGGGCVDDAIVPTAQSGRSDFAIMIIDNDFPSIGIGAAVNSRPHTSVGVMGAGGTSYPADAPDASVMVSTNEMNEVRVWINGTLVSQARLASPAGRFAGQPLAIWLYFENRENSTNRDRLLLDYIFAWQERAAII